MIDLHLHTTASDGRLAPADLVAQAAAAGLTTISVTDHDTTAGLDAVAAAASAHGLTLVPGIEITAVHHERDVHVLAYFIDISDESLAEFLSAQRARRVARVREIAGRLEALGAPIDVDALLRLAAERPGASVGRPMIADALVAAGRVASRAEAFDRYLAAGQPAFVPRTGSSPAEVVDVIHAAGGVASLAHPGVTRQPEIIEPLIDRGLDAVEAFHSDHPESTRDQLLALAARRGICVTGGSDYHGEGDRNRFLGGVTLPRERFDELRAAAACRRPAR